MIRTTFLDVAGEARPLLVASATRWDMPSALADFTVRGLAGHLARAVLAVEGYLDEAEPDGEPISAAAYYQAALDTPGVDQGVLQKGEEAAADGHAALLERFDAALDRLHLRLMDEAPERRVRVFGGMVLTLDEYLVTRIAELVVHIDDLAVSLDRPTPDVPMEAVISTFVDVARLRHGDLAVVRALARRERDAVEALRVF